MGAAINGLSAFFVVEQCHMGTIIDLSEYRRLSLAKSGQGRIHHVDHMESKTERHQPKSAQSGTQKKSNLSGQTLKVKNGKNPPTYADKSPKNSLRLTSDRMQVGAGAANNASVSKFTQSKTHPVHGQQNSQGNTETARPYDQASAGARSGARSGASSGAISAQPAQNNFKKSKIIDRQAGESLLAILYYAESEAKRLGIPDAATFIACAHEILRDYNLDVENPSQTNLKG